MLPNGDSCLLKRISEQPILTGYNFVVGPIAHTVFERVRKKVHWQLDNKQSSTTYLGPIVKGRRGVDGTFSSPTRVSRPPLSRLGVGRVSHMA